MKSIKLIVFMGIFPLFASAQWQGGIWALNISKLGLVNVGRLYIDDGDFQYKPAFWMGYRKGAWLFEAKYAYNNVSISTTNVNDGPIGFYDDIFAGHPSHFISHQLQLGTAVAIVGKTLLLNVGLALNSNQAFGLRYDDMSTYTTGVYNKFRYETTSQQIQQSGSTVIGPYLGTGLYFQFKHVVFRGELNYTFFNATVNRMYTQTTTILDESNGLSTYSSKSGYESGSMSYGFMNISVGLGYQF